MDNRALRIMAALSVSAGPMTIDLISKVEEMHPSMVRRVLERLRTRGLVRAIPKEKIEVPERFMITDIGVRKFWNAMDREQW